MELAARYTDGQTARVLPVICRIEAAGTPQASLAIVDMVSREPIERWPSADVYPLPARRNELRLGCNGRSSGARIVIEGFEATRQASDMLPGLADHRRRQAGGEFRLIGIATVALASVIGAYVYGVPLLASRIVPLIPPEWEQRMGDIVVAQLEEVISEDGRGLLVCDPDPDSIANRAIARFADTAMAEANSPFKATITVVKSDIPNAFALPGGKSFYFSALLDKTESPDEFAGVMAHELGHIAHRHGMEQLLSTAGTGMLVGFILGDMTGMSVAGAVGTVLLDSRFSREAERQADRFAADVANRMNFSSTAMADLLDRVAGDDAATRALALLSTHPLTDDRRVALEALRQDADTDTVPAFTPEEWAAIKSMCGAPAASGTDAAPDARPDAAGKTGEKNTGRH